MSCCKRRIFLNQLKKMIGLAICIGLFSYTMYILIKFIQKNQELEAVSRNFLGPPRHRFLGLFWYCPRKPQEIFNYFMEFPAKYGPNSIVWGFGNFIDILITRPEDLETVMNARTTKKSYYYYYVEPWLGTGLLTSWGKKWFTRRKILTPAFHFSILEKFIDIFNVNDKKLIHILDKKRKLGEIDIYDNLTACAMDNICAAAMGVQLNVQDDPDMEYMKNIKEVGNIMFRRVFSIRGQFPWIYALTSDARRFRQVVGKLHEFTADVIHQRKSQLEKEHKRSYKASEVGLKERYSFLDVLLQANIESEPLGFRDIQEEVDTFMFEGHDTTTSGLTFTLYHLAVNQEVQEKVFQELRSILGEDPGTSCTYEDFQNMKYFELVIKESLRMHPPVAAIGRQTLEPIYIEGVKIPTGTYLTFPIYAIHHNAKVFPDPEKFIPERFVDFEQRNRNPYAYIPFSAGNRNCIGQRFAMLEMKAVISSIIRNFKIVPTEKTKNLTFRTDLVMRPQGGLNIRLEKRLYQ